MRLALPIVRCVGTFKAIASSGYALHVWPSAPSCSEGYKVAILEPRHANDRSAAKELSAYRTGGRVIHRTEIFSHVWGFDFGPSSNSLNVYVGYLRRKTEAAGEPRLIHTVRGVGYVLRDR